MNLFEEVQNMSEEEQAELLATDFGPELEKQASEELGKANLADALYNYGAYLAEVDIESQDDMSKEASEAYNEAGAEVALAVETGLLDSGILEIEDTAELHKEAQAAAAIMFQGYSDQMEEMVKEAAKKKDPTFGQKFKKHVKTLGKKMQAAKEKAVAGAKKAGKFMGKHKKSFIGAGLAGAGALAYKKMHEKKASELSVEEFSQAVAEEIEFNEVVTEGLDKLAAAGKAKAAKGIMAHIKAIPKQVEKGYEATKGFAKKHYATGKKVVAKHPGKAGMAAGVALGAGATHAAHKVADKD